MATIFTPFERLVLRALLVLMQRGLDPAKIIQEIDLAIRTSDGQQRADEANKALVP